MDLIGQNQFDICYKIVKYSIIIITNIYYIHTITILVIIYFVTSILKFFGFDIIECLSHYDMGSTIGIKENIININIIVVK